MFRAPLAALSLLALGTVARGADAPRPLVPTHQVKLNGHTFTLPEGFTIELAAGADVAPRPIAAAFDAKGRLYVTDSSGSNENVKVQLEKKPHRILRLESTRGDGVFDKRTVFVKNVMFPEGCMWLAGSLYVAAPPHILKFTDTNDDGIADTEEVWFDGKTLTGCANDLHGPYPGPDGYIYWTKGAFAKQEYVLPNGKKLGTRAAHIFRATPDGKNIEPVMTGGMDNPVDLVFTPSGDIIFNTTFFQHPANGKRDGLVHAIYGAVYGKDHDVVYDHPWTAPQLMPPMTHLGPAAPAGLHRYENDQFGAEYTNNIFCCQFNMRKVSRHVLVPKGSTYETRDSDFLASDNIDFHPTDVIEDADGSLLVVDTGGWYKLCCPTSQLVKPDVTGAIYRVKKVGAHKQKAKPKPLPLPHLREIALKRDPQGYEEALAALRSRDLHTRRLGAEALGRIGNVKATAALLGALTDERNDRELDHALTYALIEIGDAPGTRAGLASPSPRVRRAALAALSYISSGLETKAVLAELDAPDAALRDTAWWVAGRNAQWGDELAGYFKTKLKAADKLKPEDRADLANRLVRFASSPGVQKVLGETPAANPAAARLALGVMERSGLKALPAAWKLNLSNAIASEDESVALLGCAILRTVPPSEQDHTDVLTMAELARGAHNRPRTDSERLALLSTSRPGTVKVTPADLARALKALDRNATPADRFLATEALTRAKLDPEQFTALAAALKTVSPLEFSRILQLFARSADEKVGIALVESLRQSSVRSGVRTEVVKPILDKYPAAVKVEAEKLYAELAAARKDETARLDKLLSEMKPGDIRRGQLVFNGTKANCIACHKVGYVGGTAGPDLTRIGGIRTERDLLESILYPSASFVRSYEPVRVVTKDDRTLNGVLKKDAPEEIVIVVSADKEERIARSEIESLAPSTVSLMPGGLDQQLTPQELADLIAFLRACK
ncbi:c-type cytochrome [Gemmata sp. JC717]|uniref:PVC-type heme-binding CxxCH protein n=1 Tax=Gemmata algarum TaxID=2975278 RepID=UPI0021BA9153|nr:PVC-type heme-binding CxxCH protein [Gemmata algarum]MDY3556124.1 c-type cytochrome [Gemmata algarum]